MKTHAYTSQLEWSGSTAVGYDDYDRAHRVSVPPATDALTLSSDPAFTGDPGLANPEQLLLAAASSCQLLSFLARAARARIDVVSYTDEATAEMPEDDQPMRITKIVLRPRIVIAGEAREDRVRKLVDSAHEGCFIANSLKSDMSIEPEIEIR